MEKSFAFMIQRQAFEISIKEKMFDLLNEQKTSCWGGEGEGVTV